MTIFEEIDRMFAKSSKDDKCDLQKVMEEIRNIKSMIEDIQSQLNKKRGRKRSKEYYKFVDALRRSMYADVDNNIYPEIKYNGRKLGVDINGMIYDKSDQHVLPTYEAFEVYDFLYAHRDSLGDYIKI